MLKEEINSRWARKDRTYARNARQVEKAAGVVRR